MASASRRARYAGVIVIGTFLVTLWIGSILFDGLRVCRDALAITGTEAVVETCGPASFSDLTAGWVAIGLLLLPDIQEVSVAGVRLRLRRRRQ